MRRLLFAALLLLCCAYGCIADTQYRTPYPGDPELEIMSETKDSVAWGVRVVKVVPKEDDAGEDFQNIRIAVNPGLVKKEVAYCLFKRAKNFGYTPPIHDGFDERVCDDVVSYGGRRMAHDLMLDVMPKAVAMHVKRLKVKPVKDVLRIDMPSERPVERDAEGAMCAEVINSFGGRGIPNADFVIFVDLSTRKPATKICTYDKESGRPTSAIIRLNPREIAKNEHYVRVVAHEITHGLGFTLDMKEFAAMMRSGSDEGSFPGQEELQSEKLNKFVREQFKCQYLSGMMLNDAVLGNGEDYVVHFDGELAKNELMAPPGTKGGAMKYSALTLAALESTKHYQAVYEKAEVLESKTGCPRRILW